ncbi:SOS response-associated peptidase [Arthrobacter sp. efr-133-R2A-63]|uniref:SOS response-associated peptidase n=1 Tax=Arthrobacter sp. efr-133-R2A-63 TaxID=3040278 RepID=UPI00254B08FC|nr:SOS response-associated peptidase [Arthrobacter sp. efr-133-R2A-63]
MCGRYAIGKSGEDLAKTLGVHFPSSALAWEPTYSLAITNSAPVVRERLADGGELLREGALLRWGVPDPAPERLGKPMQNARLSSIHFFEVWKNLYRAGMRALVPMSGYFEWIETKPKYKVPIFIHDPAAPLLFAAGLWSRDETFTVITVQGKDAAGEVHNRMPLFLDPELMGSWLNPEALAPKDGAALLRDVRAGSDIIASKLNTHPVSRELNNVRTAPREDPRLLEPVDLASA